MSTDTFSTLLNSASPATVLFSSLIALAGVCWLVLSFQRGTKVDSTVPMAAGGLPLLGHALQFGADPAKFLLEQQAIHGSIFSARILFDTFVFIDGTYKDAFFGFPASKMSFYEVVIKQLAPQYTTGLDAIENPWHVSVIKRQFAPRQLASYSARLEPQLLASLKDYNVPVKKGESVVIDDARPLAWEMIARCSVSLFLGEQFSTNRDLVTVFVTFHEACLQLMQLASIFPNYWLAIFTGRIKKQQKVIYSVVIPEVERRRQLVKDNPAANPMELLPTDVLTVLCVETTRSPHEIAQRMFAFIFSSMITTAGAMTHAFCDLAGRPEQWPKLLEEQNVVQAKHGKHAITGPALDDSTRLHAFVLESMRYGAMAVQSTRLVVKEGVEIAPGMVLPKNAVVCMSGVMNNVLVDRTENGGSATFRPDRFLQADGTIHPNPEELGFFPFGIGRHYCPGRHLALSEVKSALIVLLRNYTVRTVSGNVPEYKCSPADMSRVPEPIQLTRK